MATSCYVTFCNYAAPQGYRLNSLSSYPAFSARLALATICRARSAKTKL